MGGTLLSPTCTFTASQCYQDCQTIMRSIQVRYCVLCSGQVLHDYCHANATLHCGVCLAFSSFSMTCLASLLTVLTGSSQLLPDMSDTFCTSACQTFNSMRQAGTLWLNRCLWMMTRFLTVNTTLHLRHRFPCHARRCQCPSQAHWQYHPLCPRPAGSTHGACSSSVAARKSELSVERSFVR